MDFITKGFEGDPDTISAIKWRPVVYISWGLTPREVQYVQIEKEAAAAKWACERLARIY